jgi:Leucine-rich repeat (LRR) protein
LTILGNAKSLDEIQTLNLSSQHLTDEILANAEKFFIEMSSLDELDLSGNQIRFMPELEMAEVRSLNLSHNNLQNVDFIEHLWTVEELDLRGNSVIDITEKMKVRVFLPRLEILGKYNFNVNIFLAKVSETFYP